MVSMLQLPVTCLSNCHLSEQLPESYLPTVWHGALYVVPIVLIMFQTCQLDFPNHTCVEFNGVVNCAYDRTDFQYVSYIYCFETI
jgi:hypothetical protein